MAYPLPVERNVGYWTAVYPAGQSHSFMPASAAHQSLLKHPIETILIFDIVDSESKSAGTPQQVKVQATNGPKECLQSPANDTNRLELLTNLGPNLDTCSPLNFRINGGQKPYTVSLVPIGIAPTINITLGANDDSLFWVNLLPPNTTVFVTTSDRSVRRTCCVEMPLTCLPNSNGQYSSSDQFTTSGTNVVTTCHFHITHSFNSRDPLGQKSQTTSQTTSVAIAPTGSSGTNNNQNDDGGRTAAIIGGTMGGVILLGLLFISYHLRKRHLEGRRGIGFRETLPDEPVSDFAPGGSMNQIGVPSTPFGHSNNVRPTSLSGQNGVAGAGMNATSRKAARAAQDGEVPTPAPIAAPAPTDHGSGVQLRQHTDAMDVIEPPPAYRTTSPH